MNDMLRRNLDLVQEAVLRIALDPSTAEVATSAAREGALVLLDPNDQALSNANEAMARAAESRGEAVVRLELVRTSTLVPR